MVTQQPAAWRRIAVRNGISDVTPPALARRQHPNAIHTTRYNLLTWLPKSFYQQFYRPANVYFVLIAILACTPLWEGGAESKVITVVFILSTQALKDGYEDLKRRLDDHEENARLSSRCIPSLQEPEELAWKSCTVGDVLLIRRSQPLPCDVLVLASAEASGAFYMSTKSLDGETTLKEGKVDPSLMGAVESTGEAEVPGQIIKDLEVRLEEPSPSLLEMNGIVSVDGQVTGVRLANFALRGSDLQNTSWIIGLACFVGDDTKVRLNSTVPPCKTSDLERILNLCTTWMLAFIVLAAIYFAGAACLFESRALDQNGEILLLSAPTRDVGFNVLPGGLDTYRRGKSCVRAFSDYMIILYAVLPMTLYITYEMLHFLIGLQIENDKLMIFDGQKAKARNTSVIEELGQVDFLFSDKTGTLTANEMRFAFCCISETLVGPFLPVHGSEQSSSGAEALQVMLRGSCAEQAFDFLNTLALCHTVKCDLSGGFQAESPDEIALVQAASQAGFSFLARRTSGRDAVCTVRCPRGTHEHVVTHVLGFSSDRKRMSVIYRSNCGAIVMTKGADNVICRLLASPLPSAAQHALEDFSHQGLRTLIVAQRRMGAEEYDAWATRWEMANAALSNREEQLEECAAAAETHLQYLGITAVEDKLQEGVPETIALLREAGIRIWVLTGDKVETAVEIAKACRLFESNLRILWAVGATSADDAITSLRDNLPISDDTHCGMVLDGQSIEHILASTESGVELHRLAQRATSCVCCRLSPMQKKRLVRLVREQSAQSITLSIGDGANDVPMIQGAHIGVGIRGKEGSAAVQASDFAISQFRFLRNLLFCHGRRAYKRIATFLGFFMYKSAILSCSYIIYAHTVKFDGSLAFPEGLDMVFNPLTTTAAIIVLATDADCPDAIALQSPQLYNPGQQRAYMNLPVVSRWLLVGMLHGVIAWCVPVRVLTDPEERKAQDSCYWEASFAAFSAIFILVHAKLALVAEKPMRAIGVAAVLLELFAYIPVVAFLASPLSQHLGENIRGVPQKVLTTWSWKHLTSPVCILVAPSLALAADAITAAAIRCCRRLVGRATRGPGIEHAAGDATADLIDNSGV